MLKRKKPELEQKYRLPELGLFGSFARGDHRSDSDIDMLVDFDGPIDGFQFIRLAHEREDMFQRKTDVVSRDGIRPQYMPFVEECLIRV